MVHADLGALNEKDEAGKKPSCWFPNRTPSLALLGRAVFIVCIVMQMSLGKIDGSRAWRWEQGLADVGRASCASVGHRCIWGKVSIVPLHVDSATPNIPSAFGHSFPSQLILEALIKYLA